MPKVLHPANPTVEQCLCEKWSEVRSAATARFQEGENFVRQQPLQAVAMAAGMGYVLRILPLGSIVSSLVRVCLAALKPAALLYGAAKTYEIMVSSKKSNSV